jgi:parallel beta-helix repeat protein
VTIFSDPVTTPVDAQGGPIAGAKRFFYLAGTLTPATVYADAARSTALSSPVVANASGQFVPIFLDPAVAYRTILRDASDVLLRDNDNITASTLTQAAVGAALYPRLAAEISASVTPTAYQFPAINVRRYGAVGDGTTDDTVAFTRAASVAAVIGGAVYVPATDTHYLLTDEITLGGGVSVVGDGWGSRIRQATRDKNVFIAGNNTTFTGLHLQGDNVTTTAAADKNCGVYMDGKAKVTVTGCFFTRFQNGGVHVRNCQDYKVTGNLFYENPYSIASGALNGDIVVYSISTATGLRGIIAGNHCLSNNDFGIYFDSNGFDLDAVIANNVVVTCASGVEASSGGNRRHGIIAAYGGAAGGRVIITGNVCRNTRLTGIYRAGASTPVGTHLIVGNHCSANGFSASDSLAGGIYFNVAAPGETVLDNLVEDFKGTSNAANGAIVMNNVPVPVIIRGNTVQGSLGHGILLVGTTRNATVTGNTLRNNATADIVAAHSGQGTEGGGHDISGNRIFKGVNTKPAIRVISDASTRRIRVADNKAEGADNSTASSGENAFLNIEGTTGTPLTITGNEASTFYYGVFHFANIQSGRGGFHEVIDNNVFHSLNTGILVARASANDSLPVCGNVFNSVTTPVTGGAYNCTRNGLVFEQSLVSAAPTDGTWSVGDRAVRTPASGQPKAWSCTSSGSPGTWTSEGNL